MEPIIADEKLLSAIEKHAATGTTPVSTKKSYGDVAVEIESDSPTPDGAKANGKDGKAEGEEKKSEGSFKDYLRIFSYADRLDKFLFSTAMLLSIISGIILPLMTIIFGSFTAKFNDFAKGTSSAQAFKNEVDNLCLYFIYLFVARLVIVYFANTFVSIAAVRTTAAIRKHFFETTIRQEVWYFDGEGIGSISSQITTNGNRINQGIAEKLATIVQGISLFFSAFIVALARQWELTLILMTIIPVIFIVTGGCIAYDAKYEAQITKLYSEASSVAQDAISSIKTVHAFWASEKIVKKYDHYLEAAHKVGNKKSPVYGILFSVEYFLVLAATALAFWEGFRLYLNGTIQSVGIVLNVVLAVTIGATAMSSIAPQFQSITNAASSAHELFSVIDKETKLDPLSTEGKQPSTCEGNIEIRNLHFAYPSRPSAQILHGLNLSIPAGKTTALVGASGCGKSTLVGLLERWYVAGSGEILLDGMDISEYNVGWLRSNIRLVQQEPVLFSGTVFENVAKGFIGSQVDLPLEKQQELVVEACRSSNAHDFIEALPEGYDTQVGERASMLSGGQRQRIAIARSIISNPKVLLLDEATSALDPRAEGIVQDALNRVSVNKTTLVIAHKLATVRAADNIVVMSYGEVLEEGSHRELMERGGHYAALVNAQNLGGNSADQQPDFGLEEADVARQQSLALSRTKTGAHASTFEEEIKKLTSGTVNYSLVRCVFLMLGEQKGLTLNFIIATVASFISGWTYIAQALLFSRLIHVFTLPRDEARQQADFYSLMFFVVALANFFAYFGLGWAVNTIAQVVTHRYRFEMFTKVLSLDQAFFDRPENASGALASKLSSVPNALLELMSANIFLILIVLVNLVSSVILAIAYGWKLGLVVVFGGLPLLVGSGYVKIRVDQKLEAETGNKFADSAALATEAVTAVRTVASLTLERRMYQEYSDSLDRIVATMSRSFMLTMVPYALSQSLEFLVMALGFWYGSRLIASGEYTVTQFFVIFIAVVFGGQAAGQFFGYTTSLSKATVAANYILWLRTLKPTIKEDDQNKGIGPSGDGSVEFHNVGFSYQQRDAARVLKDISFEIKKGMYAACVGPSGCGKTTVISLLERFYDPVSGHITLNGDKVANMSPRLYRNHLSLVQQEPTLYPWSVRENIALGLEYEPSDEEVLEACRQANAHEFVTSLPEGMNTSCGAKGLQFSGGQRQRIAIARALIRKPRLLLLDEATSALDTHSERVVQRTLDEAAASRTTIAVAHRLSTIRHADVIFVFADGRIAEMGTHEELQSLRGRYYEMCIAQSLDRA